MSSQILSSFFFAAFEEATREVNFFSGLVRFPCTSIFRALRDQFETGPEGPELDKFYQFYQQGQERTGTGHVLNTNGQILLPTLALLGTIAAARRPAAPRSTKFVWVYVFAIYTMDFIYL